MKTLTEELLGELVKLFEKWGLGRDDWCLIGEWALILQGWKVPERKNVLDVYVNRDKLPWQVKDERQAVPPKGSPEFEDWVGFTEKTSWGLDMFPIPYGQFKGWQKEDITRGSILPKLTGGRKIRLHTPLAEVLIHKLMFKLFTEEDVGEDAIKRWWKYIRDIKKVAEEKGDKKVVKAASLLLENCSLEV